MVEVPDFWSRYVPPDEVPTKLRKFLHRSRQPDMWSQTVGYYAYGYAKAFERLVMEAISIWPRSEYLRLPLFFLARHSAELHLKEVIEDYCSSTGETYDAAGVHSLETLWNKAVKIVRISDDDEWSAHVGRLIRHLHAFDPDGQRFRYPGDNSGKPFSQTRVELEHLADAHGTITLWCEGACDMLQASTD